MILYASSHSCSLLHPEDSGIIWEMDKWCTACFVVVKPALSLWTQLALKISDGNWHSLVSVSGSFMAEWCSKPLSLISRINSNYPNSIWNCCSGGHHRLCTGKHYFEHFLFMFVWWFSGMLWLNLVNNVIFCCVNDFCGTAVYHNTVDSPLYKQTLYWLYGQTQG